MKGISCLFLFAINLLFFMTGCQSNKMKYDYRPLTEVNSSPSSSCELIEVEYQVNESNSLSGQLSNDPFELIKSKAESLKDDGAEVIGELELYSEIEIDEDKLKEYCKSKGGTICVFYISPVFGSMPNSKTTYLLRAFVLQK